MRKILTAFIAVLLFIGIAFIVFAETADAKPTCPVGHVNTLTYHHESSKDSQDIEMKAKVYWLSCTTKEDKKVAKLQKIKYYYEQERADCGDGPGQLKYVEFDPYFWDQTGRNFNPYRYRLACQDDGWNEKIIKLDDAPLLFHVDGDEGSPKYKVAFKAVRAYANDFEAVKSGKLYWMYEPFKVQS